MPIAHLKTVDLHYLQLSRQDSQPGLVEDLVMVHGLAANLAFWYQIASALLSVAQRVLLFDLRGHGRSSMPATGYAPQQMAVDLKELLEHLGIQTTHLLGHSFGGSVALHFAHLYPECVQSLALADVRLKVFQPEYRLSDLPHWPKLRAKLDNAGINLDENDIESGHRLLEALAQIRLSSLESGTSTSELASLFSGEGGKRTARHWLQLMEKTTASKDFLCKESFSREQLEQIQLPTLGIYGEYSWAVPTALALQQIWSHGQFEFIPQAGHFFPISHSGKLITLVQQFLSKHVSRDSTEKRITTSG